MTDKYKIVAEKIKAAKPGFTPKMALVLGSGLGPVAKQIENVTTISYRELPGFPQPGSVQGHAGQLHLGMLRKVPVVCFEGRAHWYEGDIEPIKVLVRTMKLLGCEIMVLTNAVGSLRPDVGPGSLVAITDHINFQFVNPLIGPNDDEYGERFVGMENAYDADLRKKFFKVAEKNKLELAEGVYLATSGPTFETPAEIRAYRTLGADTVGMSTVPETILARHCGLKVTAVSAVTNLAAGLHEGTLSHEVTLQGAQLAVEKLIKLLLGFVEEFK